MKKLAIAALVTGLAATSALAGGPGPVIVETAPVIIEDNGSSSGSFGSMGSYGVLGALALIAIVAAVASSSDSSD